MVGLSSVLAMVGVVAFSALLSPQVALNYRRRSVEGMAVPLVLLWQVASALFAAYVLWDGQNDVLVLQMAAFCLFGAILIAQYARYGRRVSAPVAAAYGVLFFAASAAVALGMYALFRFGDDNGAPWLGPALGGWTPLAFIVGGFVPQIMEFHRSGNSDGFSTLLSAIDITGASASFAAVYLDGLDPASAALYASIVAGQVLMLFLAYCVYPATAAGGPAATDAEKPSPLLAETAVYGAVPIE